jgi:hypothetical protein
MSPEQRRESRLGVKGADHLGFFDPHHFTLGHGPGRRQSSRLMDQAALAKELARAKDRNHRLLPKGGGDHDFDLSLLDVEHGVRRAGLQEKRRFPCGSQRRSARHFLWWREMQLGPRRI